MCRILHLQCMYWLCLNVCLLQSTRPAASGVFHDGGCEDAEGGSLSWHAEWLPERGSAHGRIWPSKHRATPRYVCVSVCLWEKLSEQAKTRFPAEAALTAGFFIVQLLNHTVWFEGEGKCKNRYQNTEKEKEKKHYERPRKGRKKVIKCNGHYVALVIKSTINTQRQKELS